MYKVSSDRRQAALHRGTVADWMNGQELLSPEEKLRQLKDEVNILDSRIQTTIGDERKALGIQKLETQFKIRELRIALGKDKQAKRNIDEFILEAAKDLLPKVQWKLIVAQGQRRWKDAQKDLLVQPTEISQSDIQD